MQEMLPNTYTKPLEKYKNPRGGIFQAGLYPVSANVPLGGQTGATPDGRAPVAVADGLRQQAGCEAARQQLQTVSRLDHYIASNGTFFNQEIPSVIERKRT